MEKTHKKTGSSSSLRNAEGWDGKLRVEKKKQAVLVNPEVLDQQSDPEESDDEDALKPDAIEADEGTYVGTGFRHNAND